LEFERKHGLDKINQEWYVRRRVLDFEIKDLQKTIPKTTKIYKQIDEKKTRIGKETDYQDQVHRETGYKTRAFFFRQNSGRR
jgi:hypothetical protein